MKLIRFLEPRLSQKADSIVVFANCFKKKLRENGIPESKIEVVPNGADIVETKHISTRLKLNFGYFEDIFQGAV